MREKERDWEKGNITHGRKKKRRVRRRKADKKERKREGEREREEKSETKRESRRQVVCIRVLSADVRAHAG